MATKQTLMVASTTTAGSNPWLDIIFNIPRNARKLYRFQCVVSIPAGYMGYPKYRAKVQLDNGSGAEPQHGEICNFTLEAGLDAPTFGGATLMGLSGLMDAEIPGEASVLGVMVSGLQTDANAVFAPIYVSDSGVLEVEIS